jgi:hypothetical protein
MDPNECSRPGATRVWRLRKRNLYVDAELRAVDGASEFEVSIFYGTTLTWSARYARREDAVNAARARRADLEREGWTFHW